MNYYPLPCHNLSRCRQDQIQKIATTTTKTWEKGTNFSVLGVSRDEWSVNSITFAYSTKKTVATSARQQQQQKRLLLTKKVIGSQLLLTIPHFADPPLSSTSITISLDKEQKRKKNHHQDSGLHRRGGGICPDLPQSYIGIANNLDSSKYLLALTYYFDSQSANMLKNLTRIEP